MSRECVEAFEAQLNKLIHLFRNEFDMSVAEAVGTLEAVKFVILKEACEGEEEL